MAVASGICLRTVSSVQLVPCLPCRSKSCSDRGKVVSRGDLNLQQDTSSLSISQLFKVKPSLTVKGMLPSVNYKYKKSSLSAVAGIAETEMKHKELTTLTAFLADPNNLPEGNEDFIVLFAQLQAAVKIIASLISRAGMEGLMGAFEEQQGAVDGRDKQKKLDVVANDVMKSTLRSSGRVAVMASEEDDEPIQVSEDAKYVVVFDPLDGSRNIEASIPTGTIFGIYKKDSEADALQNVLQAGSRQVAAGYALYSSATILVITVGQGTHGFTLDPSIGEFLLTHPNIRIPKRGQIYSVNDARYFDWPKGLQRYIDDIRQGKGQNPKKYSARYICSLVGDFHRTLLYGGVAMNPRSHLRLVYEANPMSFLVEQAGGKGSDGKRRILDITPDKVHQRLPLFLGSSDDIDELESYGDVQQIVNPGYEV
eukprot:jgi/Mesen1/907/ME000116S00052